MLPMNIAPQHHTSTFNPNRQAEPADSTGPSAKPTNPFGAKPTNPFGSASPRAAPHGNPFGARDNPFGAPKPGTPKRAAANPFAKPPTHLRPGPHTAHARGSPPAPRHPYPAPFNLFARGAGDCTEPSLGAGAAAAAAAEAKASLFDDDDADEWVAVGGARPDERCQEPALKAPAAPALGRGPLASQGSPKPRSAPPNPFAPPSRGGQHTLTLTPAQATAQAAASTQLQPQPLPQRLPEVLAGGARRQGRPGGSMGVCRSKTAFFRKGRAWKQSR